MSENITFNAAATLAAGIGPNVTVLVDGKPIGSTKVGAATADYSFQTDLSANSPHDIQLVYNNDTVINGQDRNLLLNSITVNGHTVAATSSAEIYHATGDDNATIHSSGAMYWGGTAEFQLPAADFATNSTPVTTGPAATDTVSFTASSTFAAGVGAHVNVIVDGANIGSTYVGSSPTTYSFNTSLAPNAVHDIQIVYDNDTVINGQDRNLDLTSIAVDGHTTLATASNEVFHATADGNTNFASSGAMYWSGTAEFTLPATSSNSSPTGNTPPPVTTPSSPPSSSGAAFYVSAGGNDAGDGSVAHPFATLAHAVAMAEGSTTHTIDLNGSFTLNSTLTLGHADSGLTIQAAPGSSAVLDGGGSLATLIDFNSANNVTLQGLTIQHTANQADTAAIVLNNSNGDQIIANHFADNGEAIRMATASNNTVSGNEFDHSATSAVEVVNTSNSNTFSNNVVNGTGAINTTGAAFFFHGANNNMISNNLVENTAGMGISVSNWNSSTVNVGNDIENNVLTNVNTSSQSTDSGAIYELGRSGVDTKSIISGNYIDGTGQGPATSAHTVGIYLDDMTSGVTVTDNIVTGIGTLGAQIHGGSNDVLQNNIFDLGGGSGSAVLFQSDPEFATGSMTNNVVAHNIITSSSSAPTAYSYIDGGSPTVNNNLYSDPGHSFAMNGVKDTSPATGNPNFVDASAGNYALGGGSAATAVGILGIDQGTMGPQSTAAHWGYTLPGNLFG